MIIASFHDKGQQRDDLTILCIDKIVGGKTSCVDIELLIKSKNKLMKVFEHINWPVVLTD